LRAIIATALIGALLSSACGGGGGGSSLGAQPSPPAGGAANVQAITVDAGPSGPTGSIDVNTVFTTVTICMPGSTTSCQTIDHIQVDTGSSGLRILGSVLTLSLPLQKDAGGNPIVECTQFVDGFSWGPLRAADLKISGESAAGLAVQVIGDQAYPESTVPAACSSAGRSEDTVTEFGANGILGVGPFISDCGSGCTIVPNPIYYSCTSSSTCQNTSVAVAQQVSNPASFFATDNNGVIIELPSVGATGSTGLSGSLVFGIGTQGNNGLASAQVFTVSSADGSLFTAFNGRNLPESFIDSGSNAFFFTDSSIASCPSINNMKALPFYCPASTANLSATITGQNSVAAPVSFSIANANTLFSQSVIITAASDLGGPGISSGSFDATQSFDWGLPFYFGRNVFTAFENSNTSGGPGPYFAF
jgi:hypothetical protein